MENDGSLLLMAQPDSLGELDDFYSLFENRFFTGTMVLEKFMDLTLRCNFEFTLYPFDRQICKILVNFSAHSPPAFKFQSMQLLVQIIEFVFDVINEDYQLWLECNTNVRLLGLSIGKELK